jgi:cytochrome c553
MAAREILKTLPRFGLTTLMGLAGLYAAPVLAQTQDAQQKSAVCVACHVTGTVKSSSPIPILWGQNEGYIYLQLRDFKNGVRATPQDATMNALASAMSDDDMHAMAKYASAQPWPQIDPVPTDAAPLKQGAIAAAMGDCGGCHFNGWRGYSANPRLRGQSPAYLAATIRQFRSGARANSPGMADMLRALDESDIEAVAAYLSAVK